MGYRINWENAGGAAAVPMSLADPLKNARPKTVKWLLYTLMSGDFGLESSAEALGMDTDDTEDALRFWCDRGLIVDTEVQNLQKETPKTDINEKSVQSNSHAKREFLRPKDKIEVTEIIEESAELSFFFDELQKIVPGAPTLTEQKTYIFIREFYGIVADNLLMMVDFAVSIGKYQNRSPAYVEYLAKEWTARGISTHAETAEEIGKLREYYSFEGRIAAVCGLARSFTAKEIGYITDWQSYGFADDIYHLAFEVTVNRTGAIKFAYMSRVLENWHSQGLKEINEISAYNEKFLAENAGYDDVKTSGKAKQSRKPKGKPSFDLTNAVNDDIEAALRGELG